MPKTLATKESGRKMMVMVVKTTVALSRQSWTPETWARAWTDGQEWKRTDGGGNVAGTEHTSL